MEYFNHLLRRVRDEASLDYFDGWGRPRRYVRRCFVSATDTYREIDSVDDDYDGPDVCSDCSGSGEGRYDGTVCRTCGGDGEV